MQGIMSGTANAKNLIDLLQQLGDERYRGSEFVMKYLISYVNGFMAWVQSMATPQTTEQKIPDVTTVKNTLTVGDGFDVKCGVCQAVFTYPNQQEFDLDTDKSCGANGCMGMLEVMK